MAGYIPNFDVIRIAANGFRIPITSGTVTLYNVTAASSIGTRAISSGGVVAEGSITGTVGDVIRVSHATYPETCHFVLTATQAEAYTTPDNPVVTYVAENLVATNSTATEAEAILTDDDNPDVAPVSLGVVRTGMVTKFPYAVNRETNYTVSFIPIDENRKRFGYDVPNLENAQITIPATGGGGVTLDYATESEILTGTEAAKVLSPETLYQAIWKKGADIASSSTISVGNGGYFDVTGTTTITDIDFATDAAGRNAVLQFDGILTLTHGSNLILPGGKNITTAAGDIVHLKSEGSDVVRVTKYQRAANFPRTQVDVSLEEYGFNNAGFAAAITAIGSTPCRFKFDKNFTVSANHTIPATCQLTPENEAILTVSGGATVTIGKFKSPGSNVKCFSGVDASNHVVFGANAVDDDTYSAGWYGVGGDDVTYPVTDICTSIATNNGGVLYFPSGSWLVNNITVGDGGTNAQYFRIKGAGQGVDSGGARVIPKDSGTTELFNIRNDARNVHFEDLTLSVGTNTGTSAATIDVDSGSSAFGVSFDRVTFHGSGSSSADLLKTSTDSGAAEIVRASLDNCQFITPNNSKSIYFDSINTQLLVNRTSFLNGSGSSIGIDAYRCGWLEVNNCDFRGQSGAYSTSSVGTGTFTVNSGSTTITGTMTRSMLGQPITGTGIPANTYITKILGAGSAKLSAAATANNTGTYTLYQYQINTSRAGTCIQVGDQVSSVITNVQEEGYNYFVNIIGVGVDRSTNIIGCGIQDRIKMEGTSYLNLIGNRRFSNSLVDTSGSTTQIISTDTVLPNIVESLAVTLDEANDWSQLRAGGSFFRQNTGPKHGLFQQELPYFTRVFDKSGSALTRPVFEVATSVESSGVDGQILQAWSLLDPESEATLYSYTVQRADPAVNPGYLERDATQDHPYSGELFNYPTGYGADVRGTVTQGTSRTTGVTCNAAHGIITCYTYASTVLAPGETISFTLTNSYIQNSDDFSVKVIDGAALPTKTIAWCSDWGGNVATICVKNTSLVSNENSSALKLKFRIEKDGGQAGITV